jgi:uncharacterized protein (TIGR04255 family)
LEQTVLDFLRLPDVPVVVFEQSPLVLTICQCQFTTVLGVNDPSFVAPFQRAIRQSYPVTKQVDQITVGIGFGSGDATVQEERKPSNLWQFSDVEGVWTVVLAPTFLSLETRAYKHFSDFSERLHEVLVALTEHIEPTLGTRLGLRYINELRIAAGQEDWPIRSELLGPLAVPGLREYAVQAMQQLQFRYPDHQGVSMHHGYFPQGTAVQPLPGQKFLDQPFYLLDMDIFREFPIPGSEGMTMDPDVIGKRTEVFNKAAFRIFRWAITDDYASRIGGGRNGRR